MELPVDVLVPANKPPGLLALPNKVFCGSPSPPPNVLCVGCPKDVAAGFPKVLPKLNWEVCPKPVGWAKLVDVCVCPKLGKVVLGFGGEKKLVLWVAGVDMNEKPLPLKTDGCWAGFPKRPPVFCNRRVMKLSYMWVFLLKKCPFLHSYHISRWKAPHQIQSWTGMLIEIKKN